MELIGFLLVAAVVIVTPGQDTALTIRNTLAGRKRATFCAARRSGVRSTRLSARSWSGSV